MPVRGRAESGRVEAAVHQTPVTVQVSRPAERIMAQNSDVHMDVFINISIA